MTPSDTLHHLAELAAAERPGDLSPDCWRWLKGGCSGFLDGQPLERALRLNGAFAQGARAGYRLERRNRHLRRAADLLDATRPGERARKLGDAIAKFETRVWPRWRTLDTPPAESSPLYAEIFQAMRAGNGRLPVSAKQLDRILEQSGPDNW
jgi:hypothetical protein